MLFNCQVLNTLNKFWTNQYDFYNLQPISVGTDICNELMNHFVNLCIECNVAIIRNNSIINLYFCEKKLVVECLIVFFGNYNEIHRGIK